MNKKLKKIITREAIILFSVMVISIALVWISVPTGLHYEYFTKIFLKSPYPYFDSRISALLFGIGVRMVFVAYPIYMLVRFFRLIKTFKEE